MAENYQSNLLSQPQSTRTLNNDALSFNRAVFSLKNEIPDPVTRSGFPDFNPY